MSRRLPAELAEPWGKSTDPTLPKGGMKAKRSPKKTNRASTANQPQRYRHDEPLYSDSTHPHELVESVSISSQDRPQRRFQTISSRSRTPDQTDVDQENRSSSHMALSEPHEASYNLDDGASVATTSDALPDSATFFMEMPIASNIDFDAAGDTTRSHTATRSTQTTRGLLTSFATPTSIITTDATPLIYDSNTSVVPGPIAPAARGLQRLFEPSANDSVATGRSQLAESINPVDAELRQDSLLSTDQSTATPQPFVPRRSARLSMGSR